MNTFTIAAILAVIIAFFAAITRVKDPKQESALVYAIKITVIGFVIIYFGLGYLQSGSCPEIDVGEPDF